MKKHFWIALALFMTIGTADVEAQGFLKKLEKTVKKEVEKKVTKEVKKRVNKGMDKGVEAISGKNQQKDQPQEQPETSQEQSFEDHKERHLKILEEKGEIVRPIVVENPPQNQAPVTGKTNGHEWIDLGLPSGTRWATCNIGATSPSQPGGLYAWGEKATKTTYIPGNSKTHGKEVDDISANATYDVATAKWGKGWRMPTKEEFAELVEYCPFPQYVQKDGRWGQEFTSNLNGRTLFLPATGYKENGSKHQEANGCGNYWTSTPQDDSYKNGAHEYHFGAAMGEMGQGERSSGFAVRAVIDNDAMITVPAHGETNGHQWVDLGLPSGTKWATCNIGAKTSEEFGEIYAWAEITPANDKKSPKNKVRGKWMSGISGSTTYDAAAALWGGSWEMPTKANFTELMENCTWEFTTLGRIKGLKATSKINGNYIFFPIQFHETFARYWASTPGKDSHYYNANALSVGKDMITTASKDRIAAYPIRPVTK